MAMVKWQCTYCGNQTTQSEGIRPQPGTCMKKGKTREGKSKPHTWVKVKKY